jgi:hypothetical protein
LIPQAAHRSSKSFSWGRGCDWKALVDLRFLRASNSVSMFLMSGTGVGLWGADTAAVLLMKGVAVDTPCGGTAVGGARVGSGVVVAVSAGAEGLHPSSRPVPASAVAESTAMFFKKRRRLMRRLPGACLE